MLQVVYSSRPTQICELLQISRKEHEKKRECRQAIRRFLEWKKSSKYEHHPSLQVCVQIEGIMLRRCAVEALLMYKITRRKRIRSFQNYMDQLPNRKILSGSAL